MNWLFGVVEVEAPHHGQLNCLSSPCSIRSHLSFVYECVCTVVGNVTDGKLSTWAFVFKFQPHNFMSFECHKQTNIVFSHMASQVSHFHPRRCLSCGRCTRKRKCSVPMLYGLWLRLTASARHSRTKPQIRNSKGRKTVHHISLCGAAIVK